MELTLRRPNLPSLCPRASAAGAAAGRRAFRCVIDDGTGTTIGWAAGGAGSMELVDEAFTSYLEGLIPARPPVLQEMEAYARKARFPIVGPVVGQLLYLLTRLSGARRVFELGSGYGYSTAWFAMGVRDNGGGEVFHVVWDEGLSRTARGYLERLGLERVIRFTVSEAVTALRST